MYVCQQDKKDEEDEEDDKMDEDEDDEEDESEEEDDKEDENEGKVPECDIKKELSLLTDDELKLELDYFAWRMKIVADEILSRDSMKLSSSRSEK
jgi:hypothetical protein